MLCERRIFAAHLSPSTGLSAHPHAQRSRAPGSPEQQAPQNRRPHARQWCRGRSRKEKGLRQPGALHAAVESKANMVVHAAARHARRHGRPSSHHAVTKPNLHAMAATPHSSPPPLLNSAYRQAAELESGSQG